MDFTILIKKYSQYDNIDLAPNGFSMSKFPTDIEKWRHFPAREGLMLKIYQNELGQLFIKVIFNKNTELEVLNVVNLNLMCRSRFNEDSIQFSSKDPSISCKYLSWNYQYNEFIIKRFQIGFYTSEDFIQTRNVLIKLGFIMKAAIITRNNNMNCITGLDNNSSNGLSIIPKCVNLPLPLTYQEIFPMTDIQDSFMSSEIISTVDKNHIFDEQFMNDACGIKSTQEHFLGRYEALSSQEQIQKTPKTTIISQNLMNTSNIPVINHDFNNTNIDILSENNTILNTNISGPSSILADVSVSDVSLQKLTDPNANEIPLKNVVDKKGLITNNMEEDHNTIYEKKHLTPESSVEYIVGNDVTSEYIKKKLQDKAFMNWVDKIERILISLQKGT